MLSFEYAHSYCSDHRSLIEKSELVGCFHCNEIYSPSKIQEWTDKGQTALCYFCGIDSVLPKFWGFVNKDFLRGMNSHWFGREDLARSKHGERT